jgi:hypothetical protein
MHSVMGMRMPEGIKWGKFPPERRGRWGTWLLAMRHKYGEGEGTSRVPRTQGWVLERLAEYGREVDPTSYSLIETGRRDMPDELIPYFQRLWGELPEAEAADAQPTNTAPEMFDLLAAMAQQTTVVTELVKELRAERQERTSMADTVSELRAEIRALAAGLAEALKGSGGGAGPAQEPSQGGQGGPPPAGKKTPSHSPVTDR